MFVWELNCWLTWKWNSGVEQYYQERQFCKFSRAKLSYCDHWPPWSQPRDHAMLSIHQELNLNCWFCLHEIDFLTQLFHTWFPLLFQNTVCFQSYGFIYSWYMRWKKHELKTIAEEINLAGNSCEDDNNRSWQITLHKCSIIIIWFVAFQCDEMITSQSDSESPNFQCLHD